MRQFTCAPTPRRSRLSGSQERRKSNAVLRVALAPHACPPLLSAHGIGKTLRASRYARHLLRRQSGAVEEASPTSASSSSTSTRLASGGLVNEMRFGLGLFDRHCS